MHIGIKKTALLLFLVALGTWFWYSNLLVVENGYTDRVSYFPGDTLQAYLQVKKTKSGEIKIYDIRGKVVDQVSGDFQRQATPTEAPWRAGFQYKPSFTYRIPALAPGLYFIAKQIPFVVKAKKSQRTTIVYPSNTINAYGFAGGKNMYESRVPGDSKVARVVSFLRPLAFDNTAYSESFFVWAADYFGTEVNYICDMDLDEYQYLENTDLLILPGHSEYWTRAARLNFDRYVDSGKHALVLSGNSMWWQVRYNEARNQMHCYKKFAEDPIPDTLLKTINWHQPALQYSILTSIGADFRYGGYGKKEDQGWDGYKIIAENSPLLAGTDLQRGDILPLPTVEYDGIPVVFPEGSNTPQIDTQKIKFHRTNLIGFDKGFRQRETIGTFFIFQKSPTSGIVLNTGSTDWCNHFEGDAGKNVRTITINAIEKLKTGKSVFIE